jgi:hypothetical protein
MGGKRLAATQEEIQNFKTSILECLREKPELATIELQSLLSEAISRKPSLNIFVGWTYNNVKQHIGTLSELRQRAYGKDRTKEEIISLVVKEFFSSSPGVNLDSLKSDHVYDWARQKYPNLGWSYPGEDPKLYLVCRDKFSKFAHLGKWKEALRSARLPHQLNSEVNNAVDFEASCTKGVDISTHPTVIVQAFVLPFSLYFSDTGPLFHFTREPRGTSVSRFKEAND